MTHTNQTRLAAGPPARKNSLPLPFAGEGRGEGFRPHSDFRLPTSDLRPGRAFTLVEMLVVITIIGILVSLSSIAVFKALESAHKARIKTEITNLESAVQAFKTKYGDYPPSNVADTANVTRFIARAFPRCDASAECTALSKPMASGGRGVTTPQQALVFWLMFVSKNTTNPISDATAANRIAPLFDFDLSRLYDPTTAAAWIQASPNIPYYYPQSGKNAPYIYFEHRSYLVHNQNPVVVPGIAGACIPYMWDSNGDGAFTVADWDANNNTKLDTAEEPGIYANPKSFQIISAGLDGDYGTAAGSQSFPRASGGPTVVTSKVYPVGVGSYDANGGDDDNLTNFSQGPLGDAKP